MKTLLVLAAGRLQVPAVTTAKRMGLRVIAADANAAAPGMALADAAFAMDICDPEACLALARRERIDGVIHICAEAAMLSVGRINEELGLSGIDAATAIRATSKPRMRRAFEQWGAPSPRSVEVHTAAEARRAAQEIGWPLIVKPARNSGSRGITRLGSGECPAAIDAAFHYALGESRDPAVLVEEFVEGPEFSVEVLTWAGQPRVLTVTEKETTGSPHFVEMGHCQPARIGPEDWKALEQGAALGAAALGIDWAASHAELRLSARGPVLMEIGARLGGDYITTELVPRSTGIDMVEGAIRLALGEMPDLTPRHEPRGAAIRYLRHRPGRLVTVEGLEEARAIPGVKAVEVYRRIGDVLAEVTSSLSRAGHVIAEGSTADEAVANAEAARHSVRLITEA